MSPAVGMIRRSAHGGHQHGGKVSADTTLDLMDVEGDIPPLHYAFLVTEQEFDEVFDRIRGRELPYWADPMRRGPARSTTGTTAAGCTSPIPTTTPWRSSPQLRQRRDRGRAPAPADHPTIGSSRPDPE